jgi:hypothetical protein
MLDRIRRTEFGALAPYRRSGRIEGIGQEFQSDFEILMLAGPSFLKDASD